MAGAASTLRARFGAPRSSDEQERIDRWLEPIRNSLGGVALNEAIARAQSMTLDEILTFAMSRGETQD